MKKIITLLTLFISLSMSSQTIVSDTLTKSLDSLQFTNDANNGVTTHTITNGEGFGNSVPATSTATLSMNVNMLQIIPGANSPIDSIRVVYDFITKGINSSLNGTTSASSGAYSIKSLIQTNGSISLNISVAIGTSSAAYVDVANFYIVAYSHNTTTGIKSFKNDLNIFSYNSMIKATGSIKNEKIKVFNSLGQVVLTTDLQNEIETNLPTGIYTIQIVDSTDSLIEIKKCVLIVD